MLSIIPPKRYEAFNTFYVRNFCYRKFLRNLYKNLIAKILLSHAFTTVHKLHLRSITFIEEFCINFMMAIMQVKNLKSDGKAYKMYFDKNLSE